MDITLTGSDNEKVAQTVNKIAEVYANQNLENKLDASKKAIEWLTNEAQDLKSKIKKFEVALKEFKEKKQFVPKDETDVKDNTLEKLHLLNTSFKQVIEERNNIKNQINKIKAISDMDLEEIIGAMPDILDNISIKILISRYTELKAQYHTMSEQFKDKHPKLLQIKSEIEKIRDSVYSEISELKQGKQEEYNILLGREKEILKDIQDQKKETVNFSNDSMEYNQLLKELEIDKDLYLTVTKRLAETTLTEALENNNIKIIQQASVPKLPLPSKNGIKILLSIVVSFAVGVGSALLLENIDKSFKSVDEAERYLGVPFLGIIPNHKGRSNRPVTLLNPESGISEAYRTLRTWILLSSPKPVNTLLITSAHPGEGKSHTAANLAVSFAQLGQTVLLVDADLRRPTSHRPFNLINHSGLVDILECRTEWKSVLQDTAMENLKVLPTGGRPYNPAELLSTKRMHSLLGSLKEAFDIIIVDAPITLSIPDVAILVRDIDAVLLVHSPVKSNRDAAMEAKKTLDRAGATLLGVVFNNIKLKMHRYYYHPQTHPQYPHDPLIAKQQTKKGATFVDMRPAENQEKWIAISPPSQENPPHTS